MADTVVTFGGLVLDYTRIEFPSPRGWTAEPFSFRQLANRVDEFRGLPYVNDMTVECTSEPGNRDGAPETITIRGLRLVDVIEVDDEFCDVVVTDVRDELANRVCPADVNQRWKDGYLNSTRFQYMPDLFEYLAPLIFILQDALAGDAFDELPQEGDYELPDDERLSGLPLPEAGQRVQQLLAIDPVVGVDGLLRFVRRGQDVPFSVDAYNWLLDATPAWSVESRSPRGLPRTYRFHFWEKHVIPLTNRDPGDSSATSFPPAELETQLEQVYAFDGRYGTLAELLTFYEVPSISADDIGGFIMTANFEGSTIERGTSQNAGVVIGILKRDWRKLWRVKYPQNVGRKGGWTDPQFGMFETLTDKDGQTIYTGDVSGAPVRMEYAEYLAEVDEGQETQTTLDDNIVIRSVKKDADGLLPVAPFTVAWESDAVGEVFRLSPNPGPDQQEVYPGRITNNAQHALAVQLRSTMVLDDGGEFDMPFEVRYIPLPSDMRFAQSENEFELEVFMVATRRLPNTAEKWTAVERDGFANGDVEVLEPEVGEEVYALRDYINPREGKPAASDGLGLVLNQDDLDRNADRRTRVLKDNAGTLVGGAGVAIGVALLNDNSHPRGAVGSYTLEIEDVSVLTRVEVGDLDDVRAREQRARIRENLRRSQLGGKVQA